MKSGLPKASLFIRIGMHAFLVVLTAAVLYPVALVVKKSVEPGNHFALSPSPVPHSVSGEHFRHLLGTENGLAFLRHGLSSALVALATTVVGLALATTAAYAFSRYRFPGRRIGLAGFLLVQMFPATLLLMPLYVILHRLGLLNSLLGLVLVYSTTAIPFAVWTLKSYFDAQPRALDEAARIDGASAWTIFWKIALPLARPGLAVTALFCFMTAWNEFILASTFLTEEHLYTLPVILKSKVGEYSAEWGTFAAGAVLTSLPVICLFYALQRSLVSGLGAGGVKE